MGKDDSGYYGILPSEVRYDMKLLPNAKLLFVEITALCRRDGYCWATNAYFAELFNTKERTIQRWIKILCDKEYCYSVVKTFRYEDGTIKKVRYICLNKKAADKLAKKSLDHTDKSVPDHHDISVHDHHVMDVAYNKINNEIDNTLDTKVSNEQSSENLPANEVVRSQRSLDIDEAFVIWQEVMGYPLAVANKERMSINSILSRKGMDLEKLRLMVRLVAESQSDKYKRFSISSYTDLLYKTNELMAWAREKQAQQQSSSNAVRI